MGYKVQDCDGDGILDHHCTFEAHAGFISSMNGCKDNWPNGGCPKVEGRSSCPRPSGWCADEYSSYKELDCDGDGVVDPVCFSSLFGESGFIGSTTGCAKDTWPLGGCQVAAWAGDLSIAW